MGDQMTDIARRDPLASTGALTTDERSHLRAIRPDWSPIWATVERLFARVDATFTGIDGLTTEISVSAPIAAARARVWPELEGEGF